MRYRITTPATADPVSLNEAKLHLKVDNTADDELIRNIIHAATVWCERYERRAYCVQTITMKADCFEDSVELPISPLLQVDSITYIDSNGDTQTLSSDTYTVDTTSEPGRVYIAYNESWPTTRAIENAVTYTYKSGYCTSFTSTYASDLLTVNEAIFIDGQEVRLTTDAGGLPDPLSEKTTYYVRDVSGSTLKLSATSGGDAITLTDDGTGSHLIGKPDIVDSRVRAAIKLLVGHLYEHRLAVCDINYTEVPMAVKSLLSERVWLAEE